jgi:hypothetical protein
MWFEAPAWSSAPHFEGHHFCSLSFGSDDVSACADVMGASPNFPCEAPATATALAPATPAAFRNPRRSVDADPVSSIGSLLLVMCSSPEFILLTMDDDVDSNDVIVPPRQEQDGTHYFDH